jgi:hypothetical protein
VYALTVITPITLGHEGPLEERLASFEAASPFAELPRTHFARWVLIHRLAFEGPASKRRVLHRQQLLFCATFDGDRDSYLDDLCVRIPEQAHQVWSCCEGYPGMVDADPEGFKQYLRDHQVATALFYTAYDDTVPAVQGKLARRARERRLALSAASVSDAQLGAAVRQELVSAGASGRCA